MIQEQRKNLETESIGEEVFETTKATISKSKTGKLFQILTSNLYKNPIGAICREITTNCWDSHKEAKVDDPVLITFGEDEEGEFISFKDVGLGMSKQFMTSRFMELLDSTKESTNESHGAWGLN